MIRRSPMPRSTKPLTRTPMVKRSRKRRAGHDKVMLTACKGHECFLQMPGCRSYKGDPTVVPAHQNEGKSIGLKVPDRFTVPACHHCHAMYDQSGYDRALKRARFDWAYTRWSALRDSKAGT